MEHYAVVNIDVIDGISDAVLKGKAVVVQGKHIQAVVDRSELQSATGLMVAELGGATVMPGLIEAHTQLTYSQLEYSLFLRQMNEPIEYNALGAAWNAGSILRKGCTVVGDGGAHGVIACAVRDAVNRDVVKGTKVVAAGQMIRGRRHSRPHCRLASLRKRYLSGRYRKRSG